MATELRKLLIREGLEANAGSLDPREIGITTDTERPMFGTASGTKFGATEKIIEISVAAPPALDQVINTLSEIACDTDAAGAGIALNILSGASKSPAILAISNRGVTHSVTVTYRTATTFTIAPGYTSWVLWDNEAWTLLSADTARNATLLQGYTPGLDGTLPAGDAGKVSRYGIGVDTPIIMTVNWNNYEKGGFYVDSVGITNNPWGVVAAVCEVIPYTDAFTVQKATEIASATPRTAFRVQQAGSWSAWFTTWTSVNDGNAGQPPAPKPKSYISGATPGEWFLIAAVDSYFLPSGGTWAYFIISFNTSTGTRAPGSVCGVIGGGNSIFGTTGATAIGIAWRLS